MKQPDTYTWRDHHYFVMSHALDISDYQIRWCANNDNLSHRHSTQWRQAYDTTCSFSSSSTAPTA